MSTSTIVVGMVVVIAGLLAIALIIRAKRSQRLKVRFGPEYNRTVREMGNTAQAEAKLETLANRVKRFHIVPLSKSAREDFVAAWQKIQGRFVDNPKESLAEADQLIQELMSARGYPVTEFEQRAADISVDYPRIVEHYRAGHDISVRHLQGRASTEDMRQGMIHYRTLFAELADEPNLTGSTAATVARA